MKKQKKPKLPDLSKQEPLTVIDLTSLGTDNDPCFGKGYDLSTKECKLCGDAELCAFKLSQTLNITRKELEEKNKYKDLDILEDTKAIKKFFRACKRKGMKRKEILEKASTKFEVPILTLKTLYKSQKNA